MSTATTTGPGAAFERVRTAVEAAGLRITSRNGRQDTFQSFCPVHHGESGTAFKVTQIRDRVLIHCFGGCDRDDVVAALGLAMPDLFDEMRYRYTDESGQLLRTVTRRYETSGRKAFSQSGDTSAAVLYQLPAVVKAVAAGQLVYLAEGEQDAHALESLGLVATTAPQGADSFRHVDVSPLAGAHVVAIVDKDAAGQKWTDQVRSKLEGVAAVLSFAQAAEGKDAADHVAAGHTVDELVPLELESEAEARSRIVLTSAAQIKPRRVQWLWEGRLALGTLGLLAGREGLGKSSLAYWLAAQITLGLLPGEYHGTPRAVLVCATEDSWAHTIIPRLIAVGADLTKVYRIEVLTRDGVHGELSLPRDLHDLEAAARDTGAAMLLLDPLVSRLADTLDTHKDSEVRRALEPMVHVADRTGMAVLGLMHHNKSGSTDPLQLVMGSKAFTAVARSVHTVVPDPDDDTEARRLFGTPKNNLGPTNLPTLAFTMVTYAVDTDDGTAWTARVEWGAESATSITEAMRATQDAGDKTATAEAADWLTDYLRMKEGTAASADAKKAGRAAGHSEDCLKRACKRKHLQVESTGFPRRTYWTLPSRSNADTQSEHQSEQSSWGDSLTALTALTEGQKAQSVQLVQSEHAPGTGAPTVPPLRLCPDCAQPVEAGQVRHPHCYQQTFEGKSA